MRDILASLSVGTMPAALISVVLVFMIRFSAEAKEDRELSEFKYGMVFSCLTFFFTCLLYLLWDFGIIPKRIQYDLSIITRVLMFVAVILFFRTLSLKLEEKYRTAVVAGSILLTILVFVIRVFFF